MLVVSWVGFLGTFSKVFCPYAVKASLGLCESVSGAATGWFEKSVFV